MSKVVVAFMEPIRAADVRWENLIPAALRPTTDPRDVRKVDQSNIITRAMHERLPWMNDDQLVELRAMLVSRRSAATGILVRNASDVDAWIAMVDLESHRRRIARKNTLIDLIDMFDMSTEAP